MLKGRLGLEGARIPQVDRHGLLWLGRGNLYVESGTLRFATAGFDQLTAGDYAVPFQMVTCCLLQPGTTISHDALRLLSRHGTGLAALGEGGVRFYASLPAGPDSSARARRQARLWADPDRRTHLARRMYAWRLGEILPATDLSALRGIEGSRVKRSYEKLASEFAVPWQGRRYDRSRPDRADLANQAINHAASAVQAVAELAVAVTGAIPQLGFIHEDSGIAFPLDIADLFRETTLLPIAFGAARQVQQGAQEELERLVRQLAAKLIRQQKLVEQMIDRVKELLDADDRGDHAEPT